MTPIECRVLDALPILICAVDLEGRITHVNRAWSRAAHQNAAPEMGGERSVVGALIWDIVASDTIKDDLRHAMATLGEGRAGSLSWELPSIGDHRVYTVQISAIGDARTVTGYAVSMVDITASHQSHALVAEAGLALAHMVTVERVLLEISQQLLRIVACDSIAIALASDEDGSLHLAHHSGFAPDNVALLGERFGSTWNDVAARNALHTRVQDDGFELSAPLLRDGVVIGVLTLAAASAPPPHRLEEMRRVVVAVAAEAAAALERARSLRRLERKLRFDVVGEFSAGVANELRNPLFGISSAAQLLRFRVKDDPVVEKNVGRILREVERLNSMVTSLLDHARPQPVHRGRGDPDAVWDAILETLRGKLESRALLVHRTRISPPRSCDIDVQQLAQVFANLLGNAIDAAPEGSDLALESATTLNGAWRCRLQHGGPPIPPDALAHVFDVSFANRNGGGGVSLALAQRIIEEHAGTIAIESTADAGTTVTIVLPGAAE